MWGFFIILVILMLANGVGNELLGRSWGMVHRLYVFFSQADTPVLQRFFRWFSLVAGVVDCSPLARGDSRDQRLLAHQYDSRGSDMDMGTGAGKLRKAGCAQGVVSPP